MVVRSHLRFVDGLPAGGEMYGDVLAADGLSMLVLSGKARVHGKVRAGHGIIGVKTEGAVHADEPFELQP